MASPMLTYLLLVYCSMLTRSQDLRVNWNTTVISQDPGIPDPRVLIYHDEINIRTTTGLTPDGDGVLICRHSGSVEWLRPGSSTPILSSTNDRDFRIIRTRSAGITRSQLARVVRTPVADGNEGLWSCNGGGLSRRYVSLYMRGNGAISDVAVSLRSSSFGSNTFTLTADTTGGPPTTFSWRRNDGSALINSSSYTVFIPVADPNDNLEGRENCLYRSTLQVTGVLPGVYKYSASNRATTGSATGTFTIEGGAPSNLQVVQTGLNMVQLTWDPPPGPPSRGYRIRDSGNNIDMTTTSTSLTISSLPLGNYNLVVTSPSQHFPGGMVGPETITVRGAFTPVITLSELTATSVRVSWSSPPMFLTVARYEVIVLRLTTCNSVTARRGPRNLGANVATEPYTDLEEYINYRAEVRAVFQSSSSSFIVSPVTAEMEFTTLSIAPSAVPSGVRIPTVASRTANVSWNAIDCADQNGPSFRYEVELQPMNGGPSRVVTLNGAVGSTVNIELFAVVEDLRPFTNYTVQVRAANDAGNGDYTSAMMIQTDEATPGNVTDLNKLFTSFSSVNITWHPPQEPNGIIIVYELTYILNGMTSMSQNFTDRLDYTINSELGSEIEVRVRAYTRVGPGPYAKIRVAFQRLTVMNVRVVSLSDTSVIVIWNEIIIPGITITEYVVYYAPVSSSRKRQSNEQSVRVSGDKNSIEISGLESTVEYYYQVTAVSMLGGNEIEGGRSPVTRFKIVEPIACGDCDVIAVISVVVSVLLTIILYSALLLVGYCAVPAHRSKPSKSASTGDTSGMAMKKNAAYGPVTSSRQPDIKTESEYYDVVN